MKNALLNKQRDKACRGYLVVKFLRNGICIRRECGLCKCSAFYIDFIGQFCEEFFSCRTAETDRFRVFCYDKAQIPRDRQRDKLGSPIGLKQRLEHVSWDTCK